MHRVVQVVVLSEGVQLYAADPRGVVTWFANSLHYPFDQRADGAASDWLMDLVSVGFTKPESYAPRCSLAAARRAAKKKAEGQRRQYESAMETGE